MQRVLAAWPLLPLAGGLVLIYLRFFRHGPDHYVFFGTSLSLAGALFLVVTTVAPVALVQIWPLFMTIVGLSLFAYGLRKAGVTRVTFTIPGVAIVVLSAVFLPFSLDLIGTEFVDFVSTWWPALFVSIGLGLILAHFLRGQQPADSDSGEASQESDSDS
jgi:hypothetical protein